MVKEGKGTGEGPGSEEGTGIEEGVRVEVLFYGALARIAGVKRVELEVASSLLDVLDALVTEFGDDLRRRLLNRHGDPRRFVNIYVNGRDIRFMDNIETELQDGDLVTLFPAVSGG